MELLPKFLETYSDSVSDKILCSNVTQLARLLQIAEGGGELKSGHSCRNDGCNGLRRRPRGKRRCSTERGLMAR